MRKANLKDKIKDYWRKTWYFIWEDDSLASWVVNIILAFILIKFIVYPGLGLAFGTSYPIVAVISGSMEHDCNFNCWWDSQESWYTRHDISKDGFADYSFRNGFNMGDIMVLKGTRISDIKVGDVVVFKTPTRTEPIIHRVINKYEYENTIHFDTKGDHNSDSFAFEQGITEEKLVGKAILRVPLLGYIKIIFVEILKFFSGLFGSLGRALIGG